MFAIPFRGAKHTLLRPRLWTTAENYFVVDTSGRAHPLPIGTERLSNSSRTISAGRCGVSPATPSSSSRGSKSWLT